VTVALAPGDELEPLAVTPDKYLTVRYAGASGDFNPIHIDGEFARQVGLPGRILHGLYIMAQVARATTEAGGGPGSLRRLSVQFRGMGLPESELTVTGTVSSVEDGVARLEVSCAQDGKAIIRRAEAELTVGE
jgi:acyl dehydratase